MSLKRAIIGQVQQNCLIADAQSAGDYSICGLALRLRDLYKWEHDLTPWEEGDPAAVLDWIDAKEQRWEESTDLEFSDLTLVDGDRDPFALQQINLSLAPEGLAYAAGYGPFLKPSFLLGELEQSYRIESVEVIEFGRELARDLLSIPAFSNGNTIFLRRAAMATAIWDEISYLRPSAKPALAFGLAALGIENRPEQIKNHLTRLVDRMHPVYLKHEYGEVTDPTFDRDLWREMVAAHSGSTVELVARTLKDTLANTSDKGPWDYIYTKRDAGLLGIWMAFQPHLPLELFPGLVEAFKGFVKDNNWERINNARRHTYRLARNGADRLVDYYQQGRQSDDPQLAEALVGKHLLPNQS